MDKIIKLLKKLCKCSCSCKTICDFEIKSPSSREETPTIQEQQLEIENQSITPRASPQVIQRQLPQIPVNENRIEANNVYVTVT